MGTRSIWTLHFPVEDASKFLRWSTVRTHDRTQSTNDEESKPLRCIHIVVGL